MQDKFVHIHTHSTSSIRDGLAKIENMVRLAKERNELFALTDHGSIQGWMQYSIEARKVGIKPIFGIETYINPFRKELMDVLNQIRTQSKDDKDISLNKRRDSLSRHRMHLILIAKNKTGFYNILQIANDAYINGFYSKQLTDYEEILSRKDGIIVTTACIAGPISEFYKENDMESAVLFVKKMKEDFGDDFYLEFQINEMPDQAIYNKFVKELSKKTKVKLLCGIDSHYIEKNDNIAHQDLLLIQNKNKAEDIGKKDIRVIYENKKGEKKTKRINLDKTTEFKKGIDYKNLKIGEIYNKEKILGIEEVNRVWQFEANNLFFKSKDDLIKEIESSEFNEIKDDIIKNHFDLDKKIENFEIDSSNKLPNIENSDKIIAEKCAKALRKLKQDGKLLVNQMQYAKRLKFELSVINDNGFSTYFLILEDIIQYCKNREIAIGAGRGSAVSSLVSYLLGITRIDPLDPRWGEDGLPFERFLTSERNAAVVTIFDGENELKFYENDKIKVIRDNKETIIKASKIMEGDEVLLEVSE